MKKIELSQGKVALVDDKDWGWLSYWKWIYINPGYAGRFYKDSDGKRRLISMHRFVMDAPSDMEVDHIDNDGLNNQRSNLRICSRSENMCNCAMSPRNKTGFRGVQFYKQTGKFRTMICKNKKRIHVGYYDTPGEAALAFNEAARALHGQFAKLNQNI